MLGLFKNTPYCLRTWRKTICCKGMVLSEFTWTHNSLGISCMLVDLTGRNLVRALMSLPPLWQALIGWGANLDATDSNGQTALMEASFNKHVPIVSALIESGSARDVSNECWHSQNKTLPVKIASYMAPGNTAGLNPIINLFTTAHYVQFWTLRL